MGDIKFKKLSPQLWLILGENKSRFPSGNALFIEENSHKILLDTNPGEQIISNFLKARLDLETGDITDIFLSHAHLDHSRGLADIFEKSDAKIHAHADTLKRSVKKARIGLYAGIPKEKIANFVGFGESLGFKNKNYPNSRLNPIKDGEIIEFGEISVLAHETNDHCLHMLDFEIKSAGTRYVLSCDYDFTPFPFYGIPQRGASIEAFKNATKEIVARECDYILSSHRIQPLDIQNQAKELEKYFKVINNRTQNVINILPLNKEVTLKNVSDFVYPIKRMKDISSADYVACAESWDKWILLAHLEEAWRFGKIKCIESGGDSFLQRCIEEKQYIPEIVDEYLIKDWAKSTLLEEPPFSLPLESKWMRL